MENGENTLKRGFIEGICIREYTVHRTRKVNTVIHRLGDFFPTNTGHF